MSPSPVPINPTSKDNESKIEKYVSPFMLKSRQSIWRQTPKQETQETVLHVQSAEIFLVLLF